MDKTSELRERFLLMKEQGIDPHFEAGEIIDLIYYFLDKNELDNLDAVIDLGMAAYPDNENLRITLCHSLISLKEYENALAELEKLNLQGDKKTDMFCLECYCNLEKFDEVFALINKLSNNNCEYLEEVIEYAVCFLNEKGKVLDKTYQLIRKGLILYSNNVRLKIEMCINLLMRGCRKDAMNLCRQLTEEHPFSVEIWYLQAELYNDCGDYENAIHSINYAISCSLEDENSDEAFQLTLTKAQYLFRNGSYYPAIRCFIELMSYKDYVQAVVDPYLAECYMRIGDYETAFDLLNGVTGQKGIEDEISFYGNLIFCCLQTGRQIVAVDLLADALKLYPTNILDYLASLSFLHNYQTETDIGYERIINTGELVRKFFVSNTHFN